MYQQQQPPQQQHYPPPPPQQPYYPPPPGPFTPPASSEWKFRWSPMIGIMYGPVPVGLILVAIVLMAYYGSR